VGGHALRGHTSDAPYVTQDLRIAGAAMIGAAAAWSFLPIHPGIVCPLRTLTGIPCPLCGMTTSVVDTVHLQFGEAIAANFAGPLAVAFALWLLFRRTKPMKISPAVVALLLLSMWLYELQRFAVI
jgi:hypothetical protein